MVPHGAIVVSATQGNSAIVRGPAEVGSYKKLVVGYGLRWYGVVRSGRK